MRCTVKDKLQEIIKAGAGTVNAPFIDKILTNNESSFAVYITPNDKSKKVKTTKQAVKMAEAEVERLNKLFHSKEFGVVATIPHGVKDVSFQPDSETAITDSAVYNVQLNWKHVEYLAILNDVSGSKVTKQNTVDALTEFNQLIEDIKEEKIKQEIRDNPSTEKKAVAQQLALDFSQDSIEFDDGAFEGEIVGEPEGLNYDNHINNKINLRDNINDKVRILENIKKKSIQDERTIARFKDIARKLSVDISRLETTEMSLLNLSEFLNRDMENIKNLIENNPESIDNMRVIQDYLGLIDNTFIENNAQDENNFGFLPDKIAKLKEDPEIDTTQLEKLQDKLTKDKIKVKEKLDNLEKEILISELEKVLIEENKGVSKDELRDRAIAIYQKEIANSVGSDISELAKYAKTIDTIDDFTLGKVLRKIYDDAVVRSEYGKLKNELAVIKDKLVKALIAKGHGNTSGIRGLISKVDYSIFKRKTKDGTHRLIGWFNDSWVNLKEDFNSGVEDLENLKNQDDGTTDFDRLVDIESRELHSKLKDEVEFIDFSLLPELISDAYLNQEFKEELSISKLKEAEAYKERLIEIHGEHEYKKMALEAAKRVENFIVDQEIKMDNYSKELTNEELTEIYLDTIANSPFNNSKLNASHKLKVKALNKESRLNLKDALYLPKKEKSDEYKDKDFQENILGKGNEVFKEAWDIFEQSLDLINSNNNSDPTTLNDSITSQVDKNLQYLKNSSHWLHRLSLKTRDYLKRINSTSRYLDTNKLSLGGTVSTVDSIVKNKLDRYLLQLPDPKTKKTVPNLDNETIEKLSDITGKSYNELKNTNLTPKQILTKFLTKELLDTQQTDLVDNILASVEAVSVYKAKREVEVKMQFIANKIKDRVKGVTEENLSSITDLFMTSQLYDVNNRENFGYKMKQDASGFKVLSSNEKAVRESVEKVISDLEQTLRKSGITKNQKTAIYKEIGSLRSYLESGGRVLTAGSVLSTFIFKLPRFKAFFINPVNQYKNHVFGTHAAAEMNGLLWNDGAYVYARSYTRKYKNSITSKKGNQNRQITELLLNRSKVFQMSSNEVYKIAEGRAKGVVGRVAKSPMSFPSEIEKMIQRPQILALLSNEFITNPKTGKSVPVFDPNNISDPHPAFNIVDGKLVLKKEFSTPENKATWIDNTSDEYVSLFSNSGKIPKAIAYINGDYRESTSYMASKTFMGTTLFMFKQWLPGMIYKKAGIYKDLYSQEDRKAVNAIAMQNTILHGVGTGLAPAAIIGTVALVGKTIHSASRRTLKTDIKKGLKQIASMGKTLSWLSIGSQLRVAGAGAFKTAQIITNSTGKNIIKDKNINYLAGFNKHDEKTKAQLNSLMQNYARTILVTSLRIAAMLALFPDEEEEEEWKENKKKWFWDRAWSDPDTTTYFFLENLLTSLSDDFNLLTSPSGIIGAATPLKESHSTKSMETLVEAISAQWAKGDYEAGENAGRNRIAVNLERFMTPGAISGGLSLGFNTTSKKDFSAKDQLNMWLKASQINPDKTDKQIYSKRFKENKAAYKKKLMEQEKKAYPNNTEEQWEYSVKDMVNEKFPSIPSTTYNEDGSLSKDVDRKWLENRVKGEY